MSAGDAVAVVLERLEPRAMAQPHRGRGLRELPQDRIEPHLRAGLQPHRAVGLRPLLRARRPAHAADLVAGEARDEHHVERIVGRERAIEHLIGDAPAPAEFHGADVHLVHLRRGDGAVGLLDQFAARRRASRDRPQAPSPPARRRRSARALDDRSRGGCPRLMRGQLTAISFPAGGCLPCGWRAPAAR